jgi:hypothetical protein
MHFKKWKLGLALVLVCLAGAVLWWVLQKGPTLKQVEKRVRAGVPLGQTQVDVETWLTANGISPGMYGQQYVIVEGPTKDQRGADRIVDLAAPQISEDEIGTTIRARVEPAFTDFLFDGEVTVYFFFDKRGILIGYVFSPWIHAL